MKNREARVRSAAVVRAAALGALWSTLMAGPAGAIPPENPENPPPTSACMDGTYASFLKAAPPTLTSGQSTTISWSVYVPPNCASVTLWLSGVKVGKSGSKVFQLQADTSFSLQAREHGGTRPLADLAVTVALPMVDGRPDVTITSSQQVPLFLQAVVTPNAVIRLQDHVALDLSGHAAIRVAPGVQVLGGRASHNGGARIFTTGFPDVLFSIGGPDSPPADGVRIHGVRIEGAEMDIADDHEPGSVAIAIYSSLNVDIANNEISRWRGSAVQVRDPHHRVTLATNPMAVRVRDNYIHHNQHYETEGYGVGLYDGAYALIERNVFDHNRHAVMGNGAHNTGYLLYRNLFLPGGGFNTGFPLYLHTHNIDMHGQEDCYGFGLYCGTAGEFMDIRHNTVLYTSGTGFKLRGTPTKGAEVHHNVFSHSDVWGGFVDDGALAQTETGLEQSDNVFGRNPMAQLGSCDFDGDGAADRFLATGETWWYQSPGRHWVYLNTSPKLLHELTLEHRDGDGRCDVVADGFVSKNGTGPWRALAGTNVLWQHSSGVVQIWMMNGGAIDRSAFPGGADGRQVLGSGEFDGDGQPDVLLRGFDGRVFVWRMVGGTRIADTLLGSVVSSTAFQGIADFDGNGLADVLWRDAAGMLSMWPDGDVQRAVAFGHDPAQPTVPVPLAWKVEKLADFDGDGRADILWRHSGGALSIWFMSGAVRSGEASPGTVSYEWTITGAGDFDADGRADILWRHAQGALAIWPKGQLAGATYPTYHNVPATTGDLAWQVQGVGDFNSDGRSDIVWRHSGGQVALWFLDGGTFVGEAYPGSMQSSWALKGLMSVR
ncbi:MAG: FG-GAP-like repeat-containing protein [Vicinamibacteria bacterium]